MNAHQQLKNISIQQEHVPGAQSVRSWRRFSQYMVIFILVVIPLSGLFRIDTMSGAFHMLDYQVWFADMSIIMGFWIMLAALLIFMYSWSGAVFCGWVCPQNTLSEWANNMTSKLLGRRAIMMDVTGKKMQVAIRKDIWLNKLTLGISFLLVSMLFAIIPLLYFFSPEMIGAFLTFQDVPDAKNLLWIYVVCTLVVLVDVTVMRHLVCKYMCVYRVWQHSFKTRETLHIAYDEGRSDHCQNCHYCEDSCFLDIDPRQTVVFDSCINCGDCVAACDTLHSKSKKMDGPGLLSFSFGQEKEGKNGLTSLLSRTRAASVGAMIGAIWFSVGIVGYQPYVLLADRAELLQGTTANDYRINVSNKRYRAADMQLEIEGLKESEYTLDSSMVRWQTAGRKDVIMHISPTLDKGLHRFTVHARTSDGWRDDFTVYHYAQGMMKAGS
ncbi:MAG: 4Fe-4S binding protein [Mariprofundaceae bacterium]|nr:4Fe-4S binding protein [Mariprofundaceae bacterium]